MSYTLQIENNALECGSPHVDSAVLFIIYQLVRKKWEIGQYVVSGCSLISMYLIFGNIELSVYRELVLSVW
jgi:hypothetical protein